MAGASHIPITLGTVNGIFDKNVKNWVFVAQRYMIKYTQKVSSHSGDPHQAAGTLRAHSNTEQTATQKAGPSGLLVQGAMIDKPAEEDTTVKQLRTAEIKNLWQQRRNVITLGRVFPGKTEIVFWYCDCSKLGFRVARR